MKAQDLILQKYGPPGETYKARYCMMWDAVADFPWLKDVKIGGTDSPVKRIYINKDFKDKLSLAFTNLEKTGLHTEIKTFDGCYNDRSVRGRNSKSLHAWAMAVDLNASVEKLGQAGTQWSGRFVAIMKAAGLFWGGDWKGRKDSMHFALFNG